MPGAVNDAAQEKPHLHPDQFPIVRRKDEERFGEYRTKRVILEIYDAMQEAKRAGKPYCTETEEP